MESKRLKLVSVDSSSECEIEQLNRCSVGGAVSDPFLSRALFSWERSEVYLIIRKRDDKRLGFVAVDDIDELSGSVELKISIDSPEDRGRGYGTDALKLLTDELHHRGCNSIHLRVLADNEPAIRCYQKVGFCKTGILSNERLGEHRIILMEYAISAS